MGGDGGTGHPVTFLVPVPATRCRAQKTVDTATGPFGVGAQQGRRREMVDRLPRGEGREAAGGRIEIADSQGGGEGGAHGRLGMHLDTCTGAREQEIGAAFVHARGQAREDPFGNRPRTLSNGRRRLEVDPVVEAGLEAGSPSPHGCGPLFLGATRRHLPLSLRAGGREEELNRTQIGASSQKARPSALVRTALPNPRANERSRTSSPSRSTKCGLAGPCSSMLLLRTSFPKKNARTTRSEENRRARSSNIKSSCVVPYPATPKFNNSTMRPANAGQRASSCSRTAPTVASRGTRFPST